MPWEAPVKSRPSMLALLLVGCVETRLHTVEEVDASDVYDLVATSERGDVRYTAAEQSVVLVEATLWGRGANKKQSDDKAHANTLDATVSGGVLTVEAGTPRRPAGVDLELTGPPFMNLDLTLHRGDATLLGVEGTHVVDARWITGVAVVGEGDFRASAGLELELFPYDDSLTTLDVIGTTVLALPASAPYEIEIFGDVDQFMGATELGFDVFILEPGYFYAYRSPGTVRVSGTVTGGSFDLYEAL